MSEWTDIGEQLRKARESKGLDLRDVAHTTRIPLATLTALEESDYSIFPSPTYARSFLSQYSEFLNVDAHDWIDAFETGDVLSNVNDHGYLQADHAHLGEHRHDTKPARRRGKTATRKEQTSPSKSTGGSSILQTLTVFFVTALFIGGGIYAYKKFEPMLKDALAEDADSDIEDTSVSSTTDTPAPEAPEKLISTEEPEQEPPLVAKTEPPVEPTEPSAAATSPDEPAEPEPPVFVPQKRTGKPPKAMVIDEDE